MPDPVDPASLLSRCLLILNDEIGVLEDNSHKGEFPLSKSDQGALIEYCKCIVQLHKALAKVEGPPEDKDALEAAILTEAKKITEAKRERQAAKAAAKKETG